MNALQGAKRKNRGKTTNISSKGGLVIPDSLKMEMDMDRHQAYLKKKRDGIIDHNNNLDVVPEVLKEKKILGNYIIVKLYKINIITEEKSIDGKDTVYVQKMEVVPLQVESGTKMVEVPNPLPYIYAGCIHAIGTGVSSEHNLKIGQFVEMGNEIDLQRNMYYLRKTEADKQPTLESLQNNNHELFPNYEGYVKVNPMYVEAEISKDFYSQF